MTDLIEKIGRFFAEQEAQIQQTFSQVVHAPARASLHLSKPQPPIHRIPTHPHGHPPDFGRESSVSNPATKLSRTNSLVRRRLSLNAVAEPTTTPQPQNLQESMNHLHDATERSKSRGVSTLSFSTPKKPPVPLGDSWTHDDLMSWGSASPPVSTVSSRGSSARDEDLASHISSDANERHRKPRPPHQKHRKRARKKKRSNNSSNNQEEDPKVVAQANAEKIAAALTLAQERAKRFQQEKLQLEREIELERQAAAVHLQDQMVKIEAVRARSFRRSSSSPMITARSVNAESNCDTESVWTADTNDLMLKSSSQFMVDLETQLREKMSLEMHVKQNCIQKHKQRERVRLNLDKVLQYNADQSSKISRLSAVKASLELELAAVLEEAAEIRQQRRDLELADEKERLKRQREAERELQIRLREEEWKNMMEEEKVRSQVAAEARAKASKRVEAHSAKLRRMMHSYRYQPQYSSTNVSPSAKSNNDSDHSDDENNLSSSHASAEEVSNPTQAFKVDLFLPPELADFEEEGLCSNNVHSTISDNDKSKATSTTDVPFQWEVPNFSDATKFREILLGLVSDDEGE